MKVGILVSGGDAPGMNAVLYSVYTALQSYNIELIGIKYGYKGLINNEFMELNAELLSSVKNKAGCILKSSRCPEFKTPKGVKKGVAVVKKHKLDCVLVLGGDGSLKGARELAENDVKVLFIPASVDNDISVSDYSLGFYTAVYACKKYIETVMNTVETMNRSCVFEVMGNMSGNIAQAVEKEVVADYCISEYSPLDCTKLIKNIKGNKKSSLVIVLQEKLANLYELCEILSKQTKREFKGCVVGYLQRGENPTKEEIKMANSFSELAVKCIRTHDFNNIIIYKDKKFVKKSMSEIQ